AGDLALFLAGGELGADAGRREESRDAGAGRAQPLRHCALRHDFKLDLSGPIESLEHHRIDRARVRANNFAYPAEFEEARQTSAPDAGIVGYDGEVFRALFDQTVDQRTRLTDAAEAAEQDDRAVADVRHGLRHRLHDLVDHWSELSHRSSPRKRGPTKLYCDTSISLDSRLRGNEREQVSPHYPCARFFGEGRHDLAGETAQAVVCRAGAAIEQHVTDAELSHAFHLASHFVGRAVERALLAGFTRIRECHDAGFALGPVLRTGCGRKPSLRFEPEI